MSNVKNCTQSLIQLMPEVLKTYNKFYKKFSYASNAMIMSNDEAYQFELQANTININHKDGGKISIEFGSTDASYENVLDWGYEEVELSTTSNICCLWLTDTLNNMDSKYEDLCGVYDSKKKVMSFTDYYKNEVFDKPIPFDTDDDIQEALFKILLLTNSKVKSVQEIREHINILEAVQKLKHKEDIYIAIWNNNFPNDFYKEFELPKF